jgi:hypothetical protein
MLAGVNRFVIHTSAHQPVDKGPGTDAGRGPVLQPQRDLGRAGQAVGRLPVARRRSCCSRAKAVSDVAVFYGEAGPAIAELSRRAAAACRRATATTSSTPTMILNRLTPGRAMRSSPPRACSYRVLCPGRRGRAGHPARAAASCVSSVSAGAALVGKRASEGSPSLADDPADGEGGARRPVAGRSRSVARSGARQGVRRWRSARRLTPSLGIRPGGGLRATRSRPPDSDVRFIHRRLADGDAYFLVQPEWTAAETLEADVPGRGARARAVGSGDWRLTLAVSYRVENGRTHVPVRRWTGSARRSWCSASRRCAGQSVPRPRSGRDGPGRCGLSRGHGLVTFQAGRGAPDSVTCSRPWRTSATTPTRACAISRAMATYGKDICCPAASSRASSSCGWTWVRSTTWRRSG